MRIQAGGAIQTDVEVNVQYCYRQVNSLAPLGRATVFQVVSIFHQFESHPQGGGRDEAGTQRW